MDPKYSVIKGLLCCIVHTILHSACKYMESSKLTGRKLGRCIVLKISCMMSVYNSVLG